MTTEMLTIDKEMTAYDRCYADLTELLSREGADLTEVRHAVEELLMLARSADNAMVRRAALAALRLRPDCDASIRAVIYDVVLGELEDALERIHDLTRG